MAPAQQSTDPAPEAKPADAAALTGLTATVRELVACSNAGDVLRRLALYSDARVRESYPEGPNEVLRQLAATPVPVPASERVALLEIRDAVMLPDGRVQAVVLIDNPLQHTHGPSDPGGANPQTERATLLFVEEMGRWRIDAVAR